VQSQGKTAFDSNEERRKKEEKKLDMYTKPESD
jgi:hypothetical protein